MSIFQFNEYHLLRMIVSSVKDDSIIMLRMIFQCFDKFHSTSELQPPIVLLAMHSAVIKTVHIPGEEKTIHHIIGMSMS